MEHNMRGSILLGKKRLGNSSILNKPSMEEPLLIYLVVSPKAISAIVVRGTTKHKPVYFVNRVLQEVKISYQMTEKVSLALVHAA